MAESILVVSGLIAAAIGLWRGYATARGAVGPLVHDGDQTRSMIEAAQPLHARPRVRLFARRALTSILWIVVAMYGAFLASVGLESAR